MLTFGKNGNECGKNEVHGNTFSRSIDGQKWENHFKMLFKKLSGDINNTMKKSDTPINKTFTMGELK